MDENEIEILNNPKKSSGPFSEEWTKAWKQLEEQVRQRPGPHLLMAFAIGSTSTLFGVRFPGGEIYQ